MSGYPGNFDLVLTQGESFEREFTWSLDAVPVNVTGFTATATVRVNPSDTTSVLSLSVGSGITLGGSAGTVLLTIADDVSALLSAGTYVWDLFLTSAGGLSTPLLAGRVTVRAAVTRA